MYVDNIIFGNDVEQLGHRFVNCMQTKFEMYMIGELSFFLGLQITQSPQGVFISQSKYLKETLNKFRMEDCKPISTPMTTGNKLCKEDGIPLVNQNEYMSMIGSLLYLIALRPDIMQAVGIVTRF